MSVGAMIDHAAPVIFQAIGILACGGLIGHLVTRKGSQ